MIKSPHNLNWLQIQNVFEKWILGSFGASVYVFTRDERGGWTEDWEETDNRLVRGGRCDVQ